MAKGNPAARVITMEGSEEIANVALENFKALEISNIEIVRGNFDDTLTNVLTQLDRADLVFVDGNHRREPTIRYFNQLLPLSHNDSIFIFDDIHWSREMEDAWEEIRNHEAVRASIDLFHFGIILFRAEFIEKRNFGIIF
jgi:predicted O-methyltransferase YrrM